MKTSVSTWALVSAALGITCPFSLAAQSSFMHISCEASRRVEFMVIDPLGRVTGRDLITGQEYQGIPGANYSAESDPDIDPNSTIPPKYWKELITSRRSPPTNGLYRIRITLQSIDTGSVSMRIVRSGKTMRPDLVSQFSGGPNRACYIQFTYNIDPSVPITFANTPIIPQVKGGVFTPSGTSIISVRAKTSTTFTPGDTLRCVTAALRWQSRFPLTLGSVTSPTYGFAAVGAVARVGNYNYQIFRSTKPVALDWSTGSEYELFTVTVDRGVGSEEFALSNDLSGGQWFVDIDYSERTDSVFYHPVAAFIGNSRH